MSNYNRALVEQLLPTVWDRTYAYGMSNPSAPEQGMPSVKAQKNETCTLFAHLADIRSAWEHAEVPQVERQAALLRFALDWSNKEIARQQGVDASAVSRRVERAVGRLTAWLNGKAYDDGDPDTTEDD